METMRTVGATSIVQEVIGNLEVLLCGQGVEQKPVPSDLIALKVRDGLLPQKSQDADRRATDAVLGYAAPAQRTCPGTLVKTL